MIGSFPPDPSGNCDTTPGANTTQDPLSELHKMPDPLAQESFFVQTTKRSWCVGSSNLETAGLTAQEPAHENLTSRAIELFKKYMDEFGSIAIINYAEMLEDIGDMRDLSEADQVYIYSLVQTFEADYDTFCQLDASRSIGPDQSHSDSDATLELSTEPQAELNFRPHTTAVPTSLSIDDASVRLSCVYMPSQDETQRLARTTQRMDVASIIDHALLERRLERLTDVMTNLETTEDFWRKADLLLQASWLLGYKGTFLEQKRDIRAAIETYKHAVKLYAIAARIDHQLAKSDSHVMAFYFLLKRFSKMLSDKSHPDVIENLKGAKMVQMQMDSIRLTRQNNGMKDPELDEEPFLYPDTILKVLY